ncbi:MAG: TonB family protein [Methylovulum sp.]|nr:TonB family protein [Methylovulum sp.]
MIRHLTPTGNHRYPTALSAGAVSVTLHIAGWLLWQAASITAMPPETPPQVIEVALTGAPVSPQQPVISKPEPALQPPKQEQPTPKKPEKPEKPKHQVKQKLPAKPTPKPKPAPKPEPVSTAATPTHETSPTPPADIRTTPARPSAPVPEPLVKAAYSSPSLKNPPTHYPRIAQMRQWEGTVILEIRVLINGSAGDIKIARSSGHEVLDNSAVEQVKGWHFIPAHKGNQTVEDWVRVPIAFKFKH